MYYSDTSTFIIEVVLYLFTFLHCKCIFFIKIVVILNKTITFALYHYDTRSNYKLKSQQLWQQKERSQVIQKQKNALVIGLNGLINNKKEMNEIEFLNKQYYLSNHEIFNPQARNYHR